MAIGGYHTGRSSSETVRRNTQFWRVDRHGRMVSVAPCLAGAILHLGAEIETDLYRSHQAALSASDYVDAARGSYCHCERDGSLSCDSRYRPTGFEIITEPMTLAAHRAADWETMFNELQARGAKSHDTYSCGLHVHVSRAALGNDDKAKLLCIAKILEFCERFQKELSAFSRRDIATSIWCQPTGYGHSLSDSTRAMLRKAQAVQDDQGIDCHNDNRYHVVNLQNVNTIEFRCFRGTLNAATFYATLAFVDGLVRWCKQHTSNETHTLTFDKLVEWINDPQLTTYWSSKRDEAWRY